MGVYFLSRHEGVRAVADNTEHFSRAAASPFAGILEFRHDRKTRI
jgi:hypothetical protein